MVGDPSVSPPRESATQPSSASASRMPVIARAYGSSVLGVASGLLTNFILLRLLATRIPKAEFGAFAIASQLTSYLANLQLGLDFAVRSEERRVGKEGR